MRLFTVQAYYPHKRRGNFKNTDERIGMINAAADEYQKEIRMAGVKMNDPNFW